MRNHHLFLFILLGIMGSPVVYAVQVGTFDIKPFMSIQEKFDDNVRFTETDKISDWITFIQAGLEAKRETKVETMAIKAGIQQKIFAQEDDLSGLSQALGLKYKREMSRYDRLTVDNNFVHADEATTLEEEFRRVAGRYNYYRNFLKLGWDHDFTQQLTAKFKYTNEYYDASVNTITDSILNRPGVELAYAFSSRTIGSILYDYSNWAYEPGGTVNIHTTQLGVKQFLSKQLYVDVKAGANHIKTVDDDETTRPVFSAGLHNEIDETTQLGIVFTKSHDVYYSSSELSDNWNTNLFWAKQLTPRLHLNLGGFTGGGKLRSGTKEKFNGVNVILNYEIKQNIKSNIGYSFTRRDTSLAGRDYDKNTVFVGITIGF